MTGLLTVILYITYFYVDPLRLIILTSLMLFSITDRSWTDRQVDLDDNDGTEHDDSWTIDLRL